jgi:SAM-dependent methyltransferase
MSGHGFPEYDGFAEFYDHVPIYQTRDDVRFFVDLAREAGGSVLEVACGTGRVLIPCARAGVSMVGLDLSAGMLARCAEKLAREPDEVRARVELHHADMRRFDLGRTFALVTIPFRGFQHLLTVEDQRRALATIRRHLADDGRFVLDLFNPSLPLLGDDRSLTTPVVEPAFDLPDRRRVVRSYRIAKRDFFNQLQDVEFAFEVTGPDGRVVRQSGVYPMRYVFRFEAEHLLVREGFMIEALYGDYLRRPYGAQYPGELVFVCRKSTADLRRQPAATTGPA